MIFAMTCSTSDSNAASTLSICGIAKEESKPTPGLVACKQFYLLVGGFIACISPISNTRE